MAAVHAPDLAAYRRSSKSKSKTTVLGDGRLDRIYALPYMNLEDLARENALLFLLNSRVRHPPSRFALMDEQSLTFAIWIETIRPQPVGSLGEAYRMDLWTGDLDRYGQIEHYEPSSTETTAGRTPNVPPGLLVLDLQAALLQALRDIVALILQDNPLEVYAETGPIAPELPPLSLHPGEDSPSVVDLALARPYLVPEKVDVARLSSLAHARVAEWVDYGWAMREDPGFFAEVIGDWHEHSSTSTNIRLSNVKLAPHTQTIQGKLTEWSHNASSAINEPYEGIAVWGFFAKQLDELASLREEFARGEYECEYEEDIPGYREILKRILTLLELRVIEKAARELSFILPSSPPWRDLFIQGKGASS
ncbi:unnamed protein product [Clonostachys rosea]|uniref:Uncharacterized protein n=1 Tax=Bionectria ochroleuca TaxID=29856 RepID=A0ABY6U5C9_BIOOC|nr:unnamed protein product [Clonostachys rosea]